MKTLFIGILLIFSIACFAQIEQSGKVIIVHPSVGKVIDNYEKKVYGLFPEYRDSTFNSAYIIKYTDSSFAVIVTDIKNQTIEKNISSKELDNMYFQIDGQKQKSLYNEENNTKKKRKQTGPNTAVNNYILTEALVQLTIITINILFALAN